jgi:hypothetical protein
MEVGGSFTAEEVYFRVNIPSADMDVSVGETHRGWSSQWLGKYID